MIDLSNTLPRFEVGDVATEMVLPFWKTVVYCCTGSVLAPGAATVSILGHAGGRKYGEADRGA